MLVEITKYDFQYKGLIIKLAKCGTRNFWKVYTKEGLELKEFKCSKTMKEAQTKIDKLF